MTPEVIWGYTKEQLLDFPADTRGPVPPKRIAFVASLFLLWTAACRPSTLETPLEELLSTATPLAAPVATRAAFDSAFAMAGHYSDVTDRRRIVVRDSSVWLALWAEIQSNLQPTRPAPSVDFASHMIVFVSMGTRPHGGFAILIDEVLEAEGEVYARVVERSPGPSCITTQALTSPVAAHLVPRRTGTVRFVDRAEVYNCGP